MSIARIELWEHHVPCAFQQRQHWDRWRWLDWYNLTSQIERYRELRFVDKLKSGPSKGIAWRSLFPFVCQHPTWAHQHALVSPSKMDQTFGCPIILSVKFASCQVLLLPARLRESSHLKWSPSFPSHLLISFFGHVQAASSVALSLCKLNHWNAQPSCVGDIC